MNKDQVEIQNLRTKINILKKTIGGIKWDIDYQKKEPYDYGESSDELIYDIKCRIIECEDKIK